MQEAAAADAVTQTEDMLTSPNPASSATGPFATDTLAVPTPPAELLVHKLGQVRFTVIMKVLKS